jgi:uncharacterized membrane protein
VDCRSQTLQEYAVTYPTLKFLHLLGLTLMGAGLIGVWYADLRSRQVRDLLVFAEAVRSIAVLYDGLVVPGALLLLGSGTWLIVTVYGGWAFLGMPWLTGMVALFAFEFLDGNTITRRHFMRLRRLTREAVRHGNVTAELEVGHLGSVRRRNSAGAGGGGGAHRCDPASLPLRAR